MTGWGFRLKTMSNFGEAASPARRVAVIARKDLAHTAQKEGITLCVRLSGEPAEGLPF